jgi:serine/threonine protein kinase
MITDGSKKNSLQKLEDYYKVDCLLGFGSYSKVKLAGEISSGKKFAVKIIDSIYHSSKGKNKFLKRELDVLEKTNHINIIKYYSYATYLLENDIGCLELHDCIILEYAENGPLFDYLSIEKRGFNERISRSIFHQIINGLENCHNSGLAHGDLKTENILFQSDWTLKLCDFGNSYSLGSKNFDIKEGITKSYCSPEIWNGDKSEVLGAKSDIFSCGVILFVLVTGNFPFFEPTQTDFFYRKIKTKKLSGIWDHYKEKINIFESLNVSNDFKELFTSLVQNDPKDRPSLDEIKKCKWLNLENASQGEVIQELEKRKKYIKKYK